MQLIGWPIAGLLIAVFVFLIHRKDKDRGYVYFLCVVGFILPTVLGGILASASARWYYPVGHVLSKRSELAPFQVANAKHPVYVEIVDSWNLLGVTKYSYFEVSVSRTSASLSTLTTGRDVYVTLFMDPNEQPVIEKWILRHDCSKFLGPLWIYSFTYCPRNYTWGDWYEFHVPAETSLKMP